MLRACFEHIDLVVLQNHFSLNDLQAGGTQAIREIVIDIRTIMTSRIHALYILLKHRRNDGIVFLRLATGHLFILLSLS